VYYREEANLSTAAPDAGKSEYVDPGRSCEQQTIINLQEVSCVHSNFVVYSHRDMPRNEGTNSTLHPQYIVGFVDGEGCFCVVISKHQTLKSKKEVRCIFEIEVREDDKPILEAIQKALGCGKIYLLDYARYQKWRAHAKFKVSNLPEIIHKVIPFFEKHPLQAKKRKSFEIFKQIANMIQRKEHLQPQGVKKIENLRAKMNK